VDDDATFCEVLGAALSKRGFAVQIAHNVDDALCLAEACPPDYAVADLKMPGPSGLDLVAKLCAQDSDLKVVVLTGYASIVTAVEAIKLGATYYLTKPTDADDIVGAFQREQGGYHGTSIIAAADHNRAPGMGTHPAGIDRVGRQHLRRRPPPSDAPSDLAAQAQQASSAALSILRAAHLPDSLVAIIYTIAASQPSPFLDLSAPHSELGIRALPRGSGTRTPHEIA